jgi:hypothetical protein
MSGIVKPPFGTPINWDSWAAKGLVFSAPMNEGQGRTVYNNVDMRPASMIGFGPEDAANSGWVPGPDGEAVAFDKIDDGVDVGNGISLDFATDFTIIVSICPKNAGQSEETIVGRYRPTDYVQYGLDIVATSGKAGLYIGGVAPYPLVQSSSRLVNDWQELAVVYKQAVNTAYMFVNGQLDNTKTATYGALSSVGAQLVMVGVFPKIALPVNRFGGSIGHISMYPRALPPEEIAYLSCVDPYAAYRWDDEMIFPNTVPAKMNHMRRMVA